MRRSQELPTSPAGIALFWARFVAMGGAAYGVGLLLGDIARLL